MEQIQRAGDQEKLINHNSIKYLYNLCKIKELNVPTLKSLYRTKCRLMELRSHIYLPIEKRCPRCLLYFSEGPASYEVRPLIISTFAKKLLKKAAKNRVLTKFQRRYCNMLKKKYPMGIKNQNKMVVTCKFCKKETIMWMTKPQKTTTQVASKATIVKKKKAVKKDKFCGLNKNAVLSIEKKSSSDKNVKSTKQTQQNSKSNANKVSSNKINISTTNLINTRVFATSDFIPLDITPIKTFKLSKKHEKQNLEEPKLESITKQKQKAKNLQKLSSMLNRIGENKKSTSKLKDFLSSL